MGKFCLCFSRFRAIFRPETVTDSPSKLTCTKLEYLLRPPAASDSGKFQTTIFTVLTS